MWWMVNEWLMLMDNETLLLKKAIEMVDLPIKNDDVP